jgi:molybdate transport repressor ModE-like protein
LISIMERDRWLGVELRHLAALEAVGRTGSFNAAALELGYTQSAISQQIAKLERIVGQRLVERPGGPRRVSLTDAGALLLRHADAIVAHLEAAQADMRAHGEGAAGTLRVGIYQSVGARILPPLLSRFREAWPRVEIQLREETFDRELLRLVEHGELDLTFADLPLGEGPFDFVELIRDPYMLLVAAGSPLASADAAPSFRELARLPLIAFRTDRRSEDNLRARVPELNVAYRTDDNGTLIGLVAEGIGSAVVPRLVVNPRNPAVVGLPFGPRVPPRVIVLAWHGDRYRSAAAEAFVAEAQRVATAFSPEALPARRARTARRSA